MELKKLTKKDMENTFLPEGYKEAATQSNYMRFEEGLNQFRILSPALTGFEYWTNENKPVRSKEYPAETPNAKINPRTGNVDVKSFWAFVVWNYGAKKIQILELTQKTIKTGITSLIKNKKWGAVFNYDIAVTRTTEGDKTSYQVQAEPPIGEPNDNIKKVFLDNPVSLGALLVGENPFIDEK